MQYPIFLTPKDFPLKRNINNDLFSKQIIENNLTPPKEPLWPIKPQKTNGEIDLGCALYLYIPFVLIAGYSVYYLYQIRNKSEFDTELGLIIFWTLFVLIVIRFNPVSYTIQLLQIIHFRKMYRRQVKNYPAKLSEYEVNHKVYKQEKDKYYHNLNQFKSSERFSQTLDRMIQNELLSQQKDFMRGILKPETTLQNIQAGHSERSFLFHLLQHIPKENILTRQRVGHFFPDFIYTNGKDVYVDIEIDEPYDHKSRQVTHSFDSLDDQNRNEYFLKHNWFVLRFSEKQIVTEPEECCYYLKTMLRVHTNEDLPSRPSYLRNDKCWSDEEAIKMMEGNIRQAYSNNYPKQPFRGSI